MTNFRYSQNCGFKGWSLLWGTEMTKTHHSWLSHAFIWKLFSTKNNILAPVNLYLSLHHLKYNWQSAYTENIWKNVGKPIFLPRKPSCLYHTNWYNEKSPPVPIIKARNFFHNVLQAAIDRITSKHMRIDHSCFASRKHIRSIRKHSDVWANREIGELLFH